MMRVLSNSGLGHDHDVFELEEVFQFGLLFGAVRLPSLERSDNSARRCRAAGEGWNATADSGAVPAGDKLDDFVERLVSASPVPCGPSASETIVPNGRYADIHSEASDLARVSPHASRRKSAWRPLGRLNRVRCVLKCC